ncbi:phenylalanyl tRNA synthetase beta chain [Trichuris trichiura]|uniref:Phenylalanine--tRNA ligase beta subunit n=1 Tax=Trichuris trichiura TaxID=36087 RepID=A0A077ZF63_TRITR|nr:phenylalanyl tRNA synthetase beta chain [Trichuris trichiura]
MYFFLADEEVDRLLFRFGLELDEIVTDDSVKEENEMADAVVYKIEVPANRCDLLSSEGLLNALQTFFRSKRPPVFHVGGLSGVTVSVDDSVKRIRPFIVAAVLRGMHLTRESYESLIDLQEKLHHNICRKRALVAIGFHDLDTLKGPFLYTTKPPDDICFQPLHQRKKYTASELMVLYSSDLHLRQYLHIIQDASRYPVIYDSNGTVLSMPPIINGEHSKVTTSTRNMLIECTALDLHRAEIVLDTLVCTCSKYCNPPYTAEAVTVRSADGSTKSYPVCTLLTVEITLSVEEVNKRIGIELNASEIACLLKRMGLETNAVDTNNMMHILVPPNRHDILHPCDVIEDVAIAYGYNKIPRVLPPVTIVAKQLRMNKLTETFRREIATSGFTEILTFALCSSSDVSTKLNDPNGLSEAVQVANPKTLDFQVARTKLLPGILKTIRHNRERSLPLKLFEIQDIVLKKGGVAMNRRNFCAVHYGKVSGFEVIHGLLDHLMAMLSIPLDEKNGYHITEIEDRAFFPGRCAAIFLMGATNPVGQMGILHPDVTKAFELNFVCASLELSFEDMMSAVQCL